MFVDKQLTAMDGALDLSGADTYYSTNVVDLGEGRFLYDTPLSFMLKTDAAITMAANGTLVFSIETDTDEAFGSAVTVYTHPSIAAADGVAANTVVFDLTLPPLTTERYVRLKYVNGVAAITAGAVLAIVYPTGEHQTNIDERI